MSISTKDGVSHSMCMSSFIAWLRSFHGEGVDGVIGRDEDAALGCDRRLEALDATDGFVGAAAGKDHLTRFAVHADQLVVALRGEIPDDALGAAVGGGDD